MNKYPGLIEVSKDAIDRETVISQLRVYGKGFNNSVLVEDCFKQSGDSWFVPIPFAIKHDLFTIENDLRPVIKAKWPKSNFTPRDNQGEVVKQVVWYLHMYHNGRISAPTGFGKTYCALQIAKQLETNVLYLVHKHDVLKQVKQVAKNFLNVKKCGEIKGDKEDVSELITLCTMQTAAKRVVDDPEWLDNFGLVIFDESHRCACKSYIKVLNKVNSTFKLAISATHRRSDGLEGVYENYIGDLIIEGKKDKVITPLLEAPTIGNTGLTMRSFFDWRGEVSHSKAETEIASNSQYNQWIVDKILQLLEDGRRPLVTTNRKEQLETLEYMLHQHGIKSVGIYAGGKHKKHRTLMTNMKIKQLYLAWHKREAVKKFKKKLKRDEKYTKKNFDAQYKIPEPTEDELKQFYGIFDGETLKAADLANAMTKSVILATTKKVGEGFDEEMFLDPKVFKAQQPMDTLIITAMTKDSTQLLGRISRSERSKHPLIIHPVINIPYCIAMFKKCYKMSYLPEGIEVI